MATELNIHSASEPTLTVKVKQPGAKWITIRVNDAHEVTWFFDTVDEAKTFMRIAMNSFAAALEWRDVPYAPIEIDDEIPY